ncbi:hypothetical protein VTJ83DRAFT_264 [Remersonia thermophila]|uniref:Zn(2)-C6 fungal-type domain-containing protein n=1 Tax=Remersonia thermophila TaxID=72144 RepID=A0ABR4DKL6_9PEZI
MNANIRKRRVYGFDEVNPDLVFASLSYPPSGLGLSSWSPAQQYILDQGPLYSSPPSVGLDLTRPENQHYVLQQAALLLNPAVSNLDFNNQYLSLHSNYPRPLDVDDHRPVHKKLRLSPESQMAPSYDDGLLGPGVQEKAPLSSQASSTTESDCRPHGFHPQRSSLCSGWTGARLSECLASFSVCSPSVCSPFESQSSYSPLLAPGSYDYDNPQLPSVSTTVVSVQPQSHSSLVPSPTTPNSDLLFVCDDPTLVAQYMSEYPPLQPERVMSFQPVIGREAMVYPDVAASKTEAAAGSPHGVLQLPPYLGETSAQGGIVPGPYAAGSEPQPYDGHGTVVTLSSHFPQPGGFGLMPGTEAAGTREESAASASLDYTPTHKTTPAKRGPFKDQDSREKTALTRKMGSCIRCRMQRIRCNLDPENEKGPCLSCKKIASSAKMYRLNCLRLKITDVKLFKPGQVKGQEWTNRWRDSVMDDIGNWESSQIRTIRVTEGYTGQSVELQVRRFRPQDGDKLKRSWVSKDGRRHEVDIPAFAIVNLDEAKAKFDHYIKDGLINCCQNFLGPQRGLLWQTYNAAIKLAKNPSTAPSEKSLLVATLDLWMSVRLTTKSFEIVGPDTLDMPQNIIEDKDNPLHGKIPLPPVMGAQIDSVIIHQIQPRLRRKALEQLQKMTQEKKQKTWLTTYLVTFILLHNIALITKHDADYARKHGMKTRWAREANVKEYNWGANTLLAYFHYCNKAVYPFSEDCKDQDLQTLAELDDEGVAFVHTTRKLVAAHQKEWQEVWTSEDYENEYYYVSQLYERNWQPRTMA